MRRVLPPIQITRQRLRYARTILPISVLIVHIAHMICSDAIILPILPIILPISGWAATNSTTFWPILAWEGVGDEMTLIFADQKKREWPKPPHDQCVQLDHNTNCPLTFFSVQFHQENCSQAFLDFYKSYHSPKTLKLSKLIRLLMEFFIGSNGGSFVQVAE